MECLSLLDTQIEYRHLHWRVKWTPKMAGSSTRVARSGTPFVDAHDEGPSPRDVAHDRERVPGGAGRYRCRNRPSGPKASSCGRAAPPIRGTVVTLSRMARRTRGEACRQPSNVSHPCLTNAPRVQLHERQGEEHEQPAAIDAAPDNVVPGRIDAPISRGAVSACRRRACCGWEAGIRTPITWSRGRKAGSDGDRSWRFS